MISYLLTVLGSWLGIAPAAPPPFLVSQDGTIIVECRAGQVPTLEYRGDAMVAGCAERETP